MRGTPPHLGNNEHHHHRWLAALIRFDANISTFKPEYAPTAALNKLAATGGAEAMPGC